MKTFLNASLLMGAYRGESSVHARSLLVLDDPDRSFVTSDFVRLEVLPEAIYHRNADEVAFYELVLEASESVEVDAGLVSSALEEASWRGLSAMDALHVAAAKRAGCAELFTAERKE